MLADPKLAPSASVYAAALESVLSELTTAHEELLDLVREHRKALSRSDAGRIQECLTLQGALAARVNQLEGSRKRVVAELTGGRQVTISELAPRLPEPYPARLGGMADKLRSVLASIQRENGVVRIAAQTLIAHIDGLMQQVARAMSQAGTYGRRGRIESGGPVPCGLDTTR